MEWLDQQYLQEPSKGSTGWGHLLKPPSPPPMLSFPRVNRSTTASSLVVTAGYDVEEGSGQVTNVFGVNVA